MRTILAMLLMCSTVSAQDFDVECYNEQYQAAYFVGNSVQGAAIFFDAETVRSVNYTNARNLPNLKAYTFESEVLMIWNSVGRGTLMWVGPYPSVMYECVSRQ